MIAIREAAPKGSDRLVAHNPRIPEQSPITTGGPGNAWPRMPRF